jgi:hypothetical protein
VLQVGRLQFGVEMLRHGSHDQVDGIDARMRAEVLPAERAGRLRDGLVDSHPRDQAEEIPRRRLFTGAHPCQHFGPDDVRAPQFVAPLDGRWYELGGLTRPAAQMIDQHGGVEHEAHQRLPCTLARRRPPRRRST